jgi:hypothetical protein
MNVGMPTKHLALPTMILRYYFNAELVQITFMMIMTHRKSAPFLVLLHDLLQHESNIEKDIV